MPALSTGNIFGMAHQKVEEFLSTEDDIIKFFFE